MEKDIASIRQEYTLASLSEEDVLANPLDQFNKWFQEACEAGIEDVNAMTLSTVGENGFPYSRIVLLKGLEENRFLFFTNYHSHKGQQIAHNEKVSLLFYWKELQRQIRIEGVAKKIPEADSDAYFATRPKESQIGAWASFQSETLLHREDLEKRFAELTETYRDQSVPRPPHWGGFGIEPNYIEFWQGRASRLHDRLVFSLQNQAWQMKRLNP